MNDEQWTKEVGQGASLIISDVYVDEPNTHILEDVGVRHTKKLNLHV
jgi:ribonuclease HIII